jgi:hypothetical protein
VQPARRHGVFVAAEHITNSYMKRLGQQFPLLSASVSRKAKLPRPFFWGR